MNDYIFDPQDNKKMYTNQYTHYMNVQNNISFIQNLHVIYDTKIEFVILIKFN